MKMKRMARLLSIALVLVMLFTDWGSRFINYGGLNKVYAEEQQGEVYIDYLSKAKELGTPLAIYNYLKNTINYEYYSGIRKGSEAVYDSLGGNDADQAILLAEMLEYIGYDTRFAEGKIILSQQQLFELTGEKEVGEAAGILSMADDVTVIQDDAGNSIALVMDHIWVEAYVPYGDYRGNGNNAGEYMWIPLDTGIKRYEERDSIYDHLEEYGLNQTEADAENVEELFASVQTKTEQLLAENPDLYLLKRGIAQEELMYLPLSLQYEVVEEYGTYETLEHIAQDRLSLELGGQKLAELTPAEMYNKRLTVSYQEAGNLLTAQIKLDGELLAEGSPVRVGAEEALTIYVTTGNKCEEIKNSIYAGGVYEITTNTQNITARELEVAFDKLNSVREKVKEENVCDEEYLGLLLDYAGKAYYAQVDVETRLLAERMDVHAGRALSVGMTGYRPIFAVDVAGNKSLTGEGSLFIDIDYDARTIASGCANAEEFSLASGMISSVYESIIWEQLSGCSSVSSMSILGDAVEDGEELYILTKLNLAEKKAELELNTELLSEIEKEIQEDKIVIITGNERTYGDWQGAGYIVLDSKSLTGEYMISGGLNGGSMDTRVDNAYLLNMIILGIDVVQICGMIHGIVNAVLMGGVVGLLMASVLTIAMVGLIVLAAQLYLEFTQMLLDYYSGDMEAGEDLILSSRINLVCELLFCFGGKAVGSVVAKSAGKSILTTFGDDIGKQLINKFGDSQTLWKYVKKLRNLGFTDDAIRDMALTLDPGSVAKLSKLSGKGLSKGLVEALAGNEAAIKKVTNISDLKIFNATQRSWDDIVRLLGEKGDEFIRVYRSYGDDVVDVLNKCGSDSIINVDLYKQAFIDMVLSHGDEYLRLYQRYGQPVTEKCIIYADELFEMVAVYGDDLVEYVISHGDIVMEGIRRHGNTFVTLLFTKGDELIRVFQTYGDDVITTLVKCGSDAIESVDTYGRPFIDLVLKHGDEYLSLYGRYGKDVTEACIRYSDELFEMVTTYGDDFVEYVIAHGDSIVEGIRIYGDDFVTQLFKHKDTFARLYTLYGDEAYNVFIAHSDELLELAVSNTDEAIGLVIKYGDEVLQGIQKHGDDFLKKYADEGDEFIDEYLNKGDEVFEGGSGVDIIPEYRPYTEEMRKYIVRPSNGYDAYLEREYIAIRIKGFDDIPTISKNTGIAEENLYKLKKHVFLDTHMISVEGAPLEEFYFQADSEIAYAWKQALEGELSPEEKEWFKQLTKHELEESRIMVQEGLPLRDPSTYGENGFVQDSVKNAHDKANLSAPQPGDYPGHDWSVEYYKYVNEDIENY